MQTHAQSRVGKPRNSEARKKQNRDAQLASRQRKQAAETALRHRVKRLEEVIEELSTTFMKVMDEVMVERQSKIHDDGLLKSISKAMSIVVKLTREVVDSEGPGSIEVGHGGTRSITEPVRDGQPNEPAEAPLLLQNSKPESNRISQEPSGPTYLIRRPERRAVEFSRLPSHFAMIAARPTIPPQTFGNGWYHSTEDIHQITSSTREARIRALPSQIFMLRLVEETLANSYVHLLDDPAGPEPRRMFRYTLNFMTVESLLYCLRWRLGPGRSFLYRSFDIPATLFARRLSSGRSVGCVEKEENCISNPEDYMDDFTPDPEVPQYLNAADIMNRLQGLNCRFMDGDSIEINVPRSKTPCPSTIFEPNTEDLMGVILPFQHQIGKKWLTMRLSIPLLLNNIRSEAVCLIKGPGFPEELLPRAIEASVTVVNEAPLFM